MSVKIKLFGILLVVSLIPIALLMYSTVYFQLNTQDWLRWVMLIVVFIICVVSAIISYIISMWIVEPAISQSQASVEKALTELENAHDKMRQDKAKDEVLLNNIGDAVVAIDTNRRVIFINKVAADMIGWRHEEVVGKKWGTDMPGVVDEQGSPIPRDKRSVQAAWETGHSMHVSHYYYIRRDGSRFPVSITSTPIFANNRITGAMIVFRDVTREKEIDKMKTEFISLASHQLRTPLSAIKWYLRMLLDGDAGPLVDRQREFVDIINESNERMIILVNDLLNISRIESGRIIIEPEPTNIRELIESVIRELQMKMHEKEQIFTLTIPDNLPQISIDAQLVRHVYMNLLTNAIKYSPVKGHVGLTVSLTDENILSCVSDEGYGIPETERHKIFQKFFRASNILKYETDGTGLGLYLAKAIIDSSGGRIWFDSKEGVGTQFWISLPLAGSKPKKGEVSLEGN